MLIGYARVSTRDQNLDLQREALIKAGSHKVFEDRISGARSDRPGLAKALEMMRPEDTLVVWKLDRLGRYRHTFGKIFLSCDGESCGNGAGASP